jgi:threonine/homoserine/homoserine lactone efflux protein
MSGASRRCSSCWSAPQVFFVAGGRITDNAAELYRARLTELGWKEHRRGNALTMLLEPTSFGLFLATGLLLNVTPGPDMLFVLASGTRGGHRAGVVAALGIGFGGVVHTLFATLGLSALLVSSAIAFRVVKYAGAAYLLYIGSRSLMARGNLSAGVDSSADPVSMAVTFRRALLTSVLNPKVAIFFLAFVPQFVDPSRGRIALQFLLLGITFCTSGTIVNGTVGILAGAMRTLLVQRERVRRVLDRATGAVFVALGARLALTEAK